MNRQLKIGDIGTFEMHYAVKQDGDAVAAHSFVPHIHNELEIYLHLEGDASFMVEKHLYPLSRGAAIVSKPNEMHNCILHSDGPHRHLCLWFQPADNFLLRRLLKPEFGSGNLIDPGDKADEIVSLAAEFSGEKDSDLALYARAVRLLAVLSDRLDASPVAEEVSTLPELLGAILSDIDKNLASIRTIGYFTDRFFVSPSTLNRLFRSYLHTSPGTYLETKKLAHSRMLLRKGASVLEAGRESGFSDCSGYIRLFKKRFGMTPREFKNL